MSRQPANKPSKKEDGAVLLTTLLVMSLMATLAVAIMDDIRFAVKRGGNVQAYAQADWYVRGAEDFTASYLSQQLLNTAPEQLNGALAKSEPILLPIEGGLIALSVRDGSQCLSLSGLGSGANDLIFTQLLTTLGWSDIDAARLTAIITDWQDEGSQVLPGGAEDYTYLGQSPAYRTANTAIGSVTELRALRLLSEDQYQSLRPFVCARPAGHGQPININTLSAAQAPLLAAILGGPEALGTAAQLISARPAQGYNDMISLRAAPALASFDLKNAQLDQLEFAPSYIWIEAQITYQTAQRLMAFEFAIEGSAMERLYRGFGEDALRPVLEDPNL